MANLNPLVASSVDPKQLSLTIKGALIAGVPIVALVLKAAGHEIGNDDLQSFVDIASDFVVAVGSAASLGIMLYGAIRKAYFALTSK